MPGLTCNCSRCGILLRLMHAAPPGAPILCAHCASLRDAIARESSREPTAPERPSPERPPAEEPAVPAATEAVVGGLVEDRAWERLQARQRKKALGVSLMVSGGLFVMLTIGLLIGSAGRGSKKKGREQTPTEEREKPPDWEGPSRRPEDGGGRPRREEEEDPDPGRPMRPIPVPDK